MDEILYLEPDEEITSVIDKLKRSKANRINLVVPRGATLLQSVVNLKLLAKEASNLKKEIGIITADKIGRNLVSQVGLTVYESVNNQEPIYQPPPPEISKEEVIEIDMGKREEAPSPKGLSVHHFQSDKESWRPPAAIKQERNELVPQAQMPKTKYKRAINWSHLAKIYLPIIIFLILLGLGALYWILPKVNIKIQVKAENFENTQDFQISGESATRDEKVFPGTFIEATKTKEEKFATTGKKNLGAKASGTLTLYNNLDSNSHTFSAGTKLSSSSKTFLLKSTVVVPGATVQNLKIVPGAIPANIEAESPGSDFNVKAGRFTIVGLSASEQEAIYGQSSNDLTGGFTKEVQVISQTDFDTAKSKVEEELKDDFNKDLGQQAAGQMILEKAVQIDQADVLPSAKVDAESSDFSLKITERFRVIVFKEDGFDQFVIKQLETQIPYDKMLTLGQDDKISVQTKTSNYDQKLLTVQVATSAKQTSRLDITKIKNDIKGKNQQSAEKYISDLSGTLGSEFIFQPPWWLKRMPNYQKSLNIELEYTPSGPVGEGANL